MNWVKRFWGDLRTGFWFVPSLIVTVSIALAAGLIAVDSIASAQWMERWPRLFGVGADGARGMLSTIAGSMMTVVGMTFSMTLMTLMLASSQYTSRILRNFMRDRVTQGVLGIFAGIFAYCLIVMRTIRSVDEGGFIPRLAVFFAVVLAICGIGAFILFIHHVAVSLQASSVIASVGDETLAAIDRLFPARLGQEPVDEEEQQQTMLRSPEQSWQAVPVERNGYIQRVDNAMLLRLAREYKTVVRMERGIGEYVVQKTTLASLALNHPPKTEVSAALQAAYRISRHRTLEQDCAFGVRQIVDIALRALSPSINDTTTAVMCVDYLTAILARLATRSIPSLHRYEEGELRVIAIGQTFASLVAEAFGQIRGSAGGNVAIMLRMLGSLQTIAGLTTSPSRRRVLREQVQGIAELAERSLESPQDRDRCEGRLARVRETLGTTVV